jgi:peptidoglycan/LPS O-acetylase OafA/YrhL
MIGALSFLTTFPDRFRRITSGGTYRPEIDGLRFFAIALVVVAHLWERSGRLYGHGHALSETELFLLDTFNSGTQGVLLFFTISGYIISSQWRRHNPGLKAYFLRRVTRIEPPYLIILTAIFAFIMLSGYKPEFARSFNRESVTLTESYFASVFYVHGLSLNSFPRLLPPAWSLEIEVQFYIIAPALFWIYYRLPRRLVLGIVGLIASAMISVAADATLGATPHRYSILRYLPYFWLGVLLSDRPNNGALHWRFDLVALASLTFLILANNKVALWLDVPKIVLFFGRLLAIYGMFLGAVHGARFRRFCSLPWIALLGGACYSIYLTHLAVAAVTTQLIAATYIPAELGMALIVTLICGVPSIILAGLVFYVCVERPFMQPDWPRTVAQRFLTRRSLWTPHRS